MQVYVRERQLDIWQRRLRQVDSKILSTADYLDAFSSEVLLIYERALITVDLHAVCSGEDERITRERSEQPPSEDRDVCD